MSGTVFPDKTDLGYAHLVIADLDRSLDFYLGILGLRLKTRESGQAILAAGDHSGPILILEENPEAKPKPPRTTGLFHIALRYPNRKELARALQRLVYHRWPLQGVSDHRVSEALYLSDADGLGLELYTDRPREFWPRKGGRIAMTTEPLDVRALLAEADQADPEEGGGFLEMDLGHVHLQVADLAHARYYYQELLGFEVIQEDYPGALFVSAGGYHHHVGLNVWAGTGAPAPPGDAVGLRTFSIRVPEAGAVEDLCERFSAKGIRADDKPGPGGARGVEIEAPGAVKIHIYVGSE